MEAAGKFERWIDQKFPLTETRQVEVPAADILVRVAFMADTQTA